MSASPSVSSLLRDRVFLRYYLARSLSQMGSALAPVALALTVLGDYDAAGLGLLLASQVVPQLILTLVGGVAGDRVERRTVLVGANLVMALTQGGTAVVLLLSVDSLVSLVLLQAVYGAARAFASPASAGIVRDLVGRESVRTANALLNATRDSMMIVGPIVGGVMVVTVGGGYALAIDALSFAACALLIWTIRLQPLSSTEDTTFLEDLRGGWSALMARPWATAMIASFSFYQAAILPCMFVLGPALAIEGAIGRSGWAITLSAQGAGAVLGGLAVLKWAPRRPLVIASVSVVGQSAFLLALAAGSTTWPLAALGLVASAGVIAGDTLWSSTLQSAVPENLVSRLTSYDYLGSLAFFPIGMVVVPLLAELTGLGPLLVVVAVANAAVAALVLVVPSVWKVNENLDVVRARAMTSR